MRDAEKMLECIKNRPSPLPPADFTYGVMELTQTATTDSLPDILTAWAGRPILRRLLSPLGDTADRWDFVLQLFLAAFGHWVLAATLALGLLRLDFASARLWIGLQPAIFFILGAWLIFFGIVLWKRIRDFRRLAFIAVFGYVWIMTLDVGLLAARA